MFAGVNGLAVVVCVVVAIVVGFARYSKPLFLKPWLAGIGKPPEFAQQARPINYVITIAAAFVEALFLAALIGVMGGTGAAAGLQAGFLVWLGFVATTSAANAAFGDRSWTVWGIEAGNHLVTLLLDGSRPDPDAVAFAQGRGGGAAWAAVSSTLSAAFRRGRCLCHDTCAAVSRGKTASGGRLHRSSGKP